MSSLPGAMVPCPPAVTRYPNGSFWLEIPHEVRDDRTAVPTQEQIRHRLEAFTGGRVVTLASEGALTYSGFGRISEFIAQRG